MVHAQRDYFAFELDIFLYLLSTASDTIRDLAADKTIYVLIMIFVEDGI